MTLWIERGIGVVRGLFLDREISEGMELISG
jgi:hypothetical protein